MRVRVRYDTPNEQGDTRRERYAAFDPPQDAPDFDLPLSGLYLWHWYFNLSGSLRRIRDGLCEPIPPSEFMAWKEATGTIVYPGEYAILQAMDAAYCEEVNRELADQRQRRDDALQADIKAAKGKGRGGRG